MRNALWAGVFTLAMSASGALAVSSVSYDFNGGRQAASVTPASPTSTPNSPRVTP